jgi:hypothetical protein
VILEAFRFSMCGGENPGPCAATPWFDDFTLAEFPKGK